MTSKSTPKKIRGWYVGEPRDFRGRGRLLFTGFVLLSVILGYHLVDLQVRQAPDLALRAAEQHLSSITIPAQRGRIFDTQGRLLASDLNVYAVFGDPVMVGLQKTLVINQLSPLLGIDSPTLAEDLATPGRFVYLKHHVSQDVVDKLTALNLPGIGTLPEELRQYNQSALPNASFAANLLGYVNHDGNGQYGIESYYDQKLHGQDGRESVIRDLQGNAIVLGNTSDIAPHDGVDLNLGLDSTIQYWAEQALAAGVDRAQGQSGQLLVMDTKTGAIVAWADYPTYDANNFGTANIANFNDLATTGLYEPGSVMKVVTFAGALSRNVITPDTTFNEGPITVDGYTIRDWDSRAHGNVTTSYVLQQSLNDGAIHIENMEGNDAFYSNLLNFGIGSATGVDLAGEANQPLLPQDQWRQSDFDTASFGQTVETTPVGMLAAINAVANGGKWVQPHAVVSTTDPNTGITSPFVPQARQVMSPDSAKTLATMMTGVVDVQGASGYAARMPGFKGEIAGKTGTAQAPANGKYAGDVIDSFVGFMPAQNPRFTMLVVVRYPQENFIAREGAYLCGPVWHDVAQMIVNQWHISP